MKFKFEDKDYDFDLLSDLKVHEAMLIHDRAGIGLREWLPELNKGNPYATAALIYIVKRRAGEAIRWDDLLQMNLLSLVVLDDNDDDDQEPEGEAKPDPTSRSGRSRKAATSNT